MKLKDFIDQNLNSCKNKTFIITGANSGIGFEISKILSYKGANIVLACRNESKAKKAIDELKKLCPNSQYFYCHYDQGDFNEIHAFLNKILANWPYFDGIILNAGILKPKKEYYTAQGFKAVIGTNLLGLVYFNEQIKKMNFPNINRKKIIFQGSLVAHHAHYKINELLTIDSHTFHAYNISKLGLENYFYHQDFDNKNNFNYYLCEPGICNSNIYNSLPKFLLPLASAFMKTFFHSTAKGSLSACLLACNDFKSGTFMAPKGIGNIKGFPKIINSSKLNKKHQQINDDVLKSIEPFLN